MPTVADVETIAKTLGSILAGKPQSHGALTVSPILAPMQTEPEWLTLAEAGDRVRITEISEGGSVPDLRVANLGDLPLLLLDGEQLVGGKQNRILNMTVLVAAQTEVTIPVSCVEQGRWGYRARHSAPSDFSLYAGLRAKKSAWVSRSLREGARPHGRSGGRLGGPRPEGGSARCPEPHRGHAGLLRPPRAGDGQGARGAGARPGPGGRRRLRGRTLGRARPAGGPAPLQPRLAATLRRLCRRCPAPRPGRASCTRAVAPLEDAGGLPRRTGPGRGLGAEYRLVGEKLAGAPQVAKERAAHLMVLPVNAPVDRRNVRRFGSKGRPLRAVDKLGVDLVCERIATPLIHVMEDALNRGTLPLDTSRRAELEHDDCAAPGVEDKEIVWIAAMRDGRFEGSHGALNTHALVVVGDWIERKHRHRDE